MITNLVIILKSSIFNFKDLIICNIYVKEWQLLKFIMNILGYLDSQMLNNSQLSQEGFITSCLLYEIILVCPSKIIVKYLLFKSFN